MLQKAIEFAQEKHKGQFRKGNIKVPFIIHPMEVMFTVGYLGGSQEAQMMAVLHDTIEDTNTSRIELEREFGVNVADGVFNLTDNIETVANRLRKDGLTEDEVSEIINDRSKLKREFKRQQFLDIPFKTVNVKLVKIADKINNVKSLIVTPPNWDKETKLRYINSCSGICCHAFISDPDALQQAWNLFEKIRNEVKRKIK